MKRRLFLALFLLLACGAGCTKFDLRKPIPWGAGDEGPPGRPIRVIALWQETVMTQGDNPPVRGFGGRLMFYGEQNDKPIKVEGTLTVYAYDEADRDPNQVVPDRKYVFTSEQFEKHYSKSPLGHSYSVWVPWDAVGGEQKDVSMMCRFTPKEGGVIMGEQTTHMLPGTKPFSQVEYRLPPQSHAVVTRADGPVHPASYDELVPPSEQLQALPPIQERQKMTTTTIRVPPRFGQGPPTADVPIRETRGPIVASPATAVPAAVPESQPRAERSAVRSPHERHRALGEPLSRLDRGRDPWRLPPATPPSDPRQPQRSGTRTLFQGGGGDGSPGPR